MSFLIKNVWIYILSVKLDFRKNGVILWHEGVIVDADLINCQKELMSHEFEEEFEFQLIEAQV